MAGRGRSRRDPGQGRLAPVQQNPDTGVLDFLLEMDELDEVRTAKDEEE